MSRELVGVERDAFFSSHVGNPEVADYLWRHEPVYGVVISDPGVDTLLWYDAVGRLHVIDVTDKQSFVASVKKAPYEPPGSSLIQNLYEQSQSFAHTVTNVALALAALMAAVYFFGGPNHARPL